MCITTQLAMYIVRNYKALAFTLFSGWYFLTLWIFIFTSCVITPLSVVEFPLFGDITSFELGNLKLLLEISIVITSKYGQEFYKYLYVKTLLCIVNTLYSGCLCGGANFCFFVRQNNLMKINSYESSWNEHAHMLQHVFAQLLSCITTTANGLV